MKTRNFVTFLVAVLLAASTAGALPTVAAPPDGRTATVVDVVDGDTVDVRFANGTTETVRLLGVDTPEPSATVSPDEFGLPDTPAARAHLRVAAADASAFAERRLAGETVRLVADPAADDRGSFGRLLRYVLVDGTAVNEALLERGHARVYESSFSNLTRYRELEADARAANRGLWNFTAGNESGNGTAAATTAANASLVVSDSQIDAPGHEYENLDKETVTLQNVGRESVVLEGWTIRDPANHIYTFGDRTLAPGETVTLVTGIGNDTAERVYWNREAPVWNNDGGDTVIVAAPDGTVVQNATISENDVRECRRPMAPVAGGGAAPHDPDCDGAHEDVDGDGTADLDDVFTLAFEVLPRVGERSEVRLAFDFDGDGAVTLDDVFALAFG